MNRFISFFVSVIAISFSVSSSVYGLGGKGTAKCAQRVSGMAVRGSSRLTREEFDNLFFSAASTGDFDFEMSFEGLSDGNARRLELALIVSALKRLGFKKVNAWIQGQGDAIARFKYVIPETGSKRNDLGLLLGRLIMATRVWPSSDTALALAKPSASQQSMIEVTVRQNTGRSREEKKVLLFQSAPEASTGVDVSDELTFLSVNEIGLR